MKNKFITTLLFIVSSAAFTACKSKTDDATLKSEVTSNIANPSINVAVAYGVVTLSGTCPDDNCKTSSEAAAKNTKDVKSVINNINVEAAATTTPVAPVIADDATLKNSVDSVVKSYTGVNAEVTNGVVTLRGNIKRSNLQDLIIALNSVHPKKIDNQLVIK
jgi:osmotically-inducible protein OsmY